MGKMTKLNGIGEYELQACFDCGNGCGPDNENCGNCQKSLDAYQRLGEYESTGLTPEEVDRLNKFVDSQAAGLLAERDQPQAENGQLRAVITQMGPGFFTRKCRVCGCDWNHPCNDNDFWIENDLCSACAEKTSKQGK